MQDRVCSHVGELGISCAKEYRGEGVGSLLMQLVIDEAIHAIAQLEIVTLWVFADNALARQMYKKFGFIEFGILPNGVKRRGKVNDNIQMYKVLRESYYKGCRLFVLL